MKLFRQANRGRFEGARAASRWLLLPLLLIPAPLLGESREDALRFPEVSGLELKRDSPGVRVSIFPEEPYLERALGGQRLHLDLVVENRLKKPLHIARIELRILDRDGQLTQRKFIERFNGTGILTIPWREVEPDQVLVVFNPFFFFEPWRKLQVLEYVIVLREPDTDKLHRARVTVKPVEYRTRTDLVLPVTDLVTVADGHDFYSHHRRQKQGEIGEPEFQDNPVRYAYDFAIVNERGELYEGDPLKVSAWHSHGVPVVAPGDGTVIHTANDVPENRIVSGRIVRTDLDLQDQGLGNHVILDHGNEEFSHLVHLLAGSVSVKAGDRVEQGQRIGRIGFSGDTNIPVHLHYELSDSSDPDGGKSLPSYFRNFIRVLGGDTILVPLGTVDTGEIVKSIHPASSK
jgi:hypothetical protein